MGCYRQEWVNARRLLVTDRETLPRKHLSEIPTIQPVTRTPLQTQVVTDYYEVKLFGWGLPVL